MIKPVILLGITISWKIIVGERKFNGSVINFTLMSNFTPFYSSCRTTVSFCSPPVERILYLFSNGCLLLKIVLNSYHQWYYAIWSMLISKLCVKTLYPTNSRLSYNVSLFGGHHTKKRLERSSFTYPLNSSYLHWL